MGYIFRSSHNPAFFYNPLEFVLISGLRYARNAIGHFLAIQTAICYKKGVYNKGPPG